MNPTDIAQVIDDLCKSVGRGSLISANDVWQNIGHATPLSHPNGTMGRGFTLASKSGLISNTGTVIKSNHPRRKHGMIAVWKVQ